MPARLPGLLTVVLAAALMTGCSESQARLDVELPATWHEINGPGVIVLRPDGTADVQHFPLPSSGSCGLAESAYSGEVEWRAVAAGRFMVHVEGSEVRVGADAQMDSLNWDKLVVSVCGDDTPEEDVVVFSGGPGSGW